MRFNRGLYATILTETNEAKEAVGAFLVSLVGRGYPDESDDFGDPTHPEVASRFPVDEFGSGRSLVDWVASVSPLGLGTAVMLPIAGHGDHDARPSYIVVGRVAQGRHDTHGTFHDMRSYAETGWRDHGAGIPLLQPRLNVPIPANVPTLISARAKITVKSATPQIACWGRIKIGSGDSILPVGDQSSTAVSAPLEENVQHAFGYAGHAGYSDEWTDIEMFHARRVLISSTPPKVEGEIVPVRLYVYASSIEATNAIRGGYLTVTRSPA